MTQRGMVRITEVYVESDPNRGNMVILKEDPDGDRFFLMFVGDSEFAAIAKEKGLVEPKRPLTHDLYLNILGKSGVEFQRVRFTKCGKKPTMRTSSSVRTARIRPWTAARAMRWPWH